KSLFSKTVDSLSTINTGIIDVRKTIEKNKANSALFLMNISSILTYYQLYRAITKIWLINETLGIMKYLKSKLNQLQIKLK
ncbi:MAG: hypothetical protein ACXAB7_07910, partial [Candidatus Kariarchaeaceae archaeon]